MASSGNAMVDAYERDLEANAPIEREERQRYKYLINMAKTSPKYSAYNLLSEIQEYFEFCDENGFERYEADLLYDLIREGI